jgi:hypothetical protein
MRGKGNCDWGCGVVREGRSGDGECWRGKTWWKSPRGRLALTKDIGTTNLLLRSSGREPLVNLGTRGEAPALAPCTDDAMSWVRSPFALAGLAALRAAKKASSTIRAEGTPSCRLQVHLPMPNMCKLNDSARSTSARPSYLRSVLGIIQYNRIVAEHGICPPHCALPA